MYKHAWMEKMEKLFLLFYDAIIQQVSLLIEILCNVKYFRFDYISRGNEWIVIV